MTAVLLLVLLAAASPAALGKTPEPGLRAAQDGGMPREDRRREPDLDRELAETMERFMVQRLSTFLELDEAQEGEVVPRIQELARLRRQHGQQRREAIRTRMAMSQDQGTDESLIRERLDAFHDENDAFRRRQDDVLDEIRQRLNPRQQARLLAFEERFRDEMRRRIEDARRDGRPGMPRRRPGQRVPRR